MAVDAIFEDLNEQVLATFASTTPVTYFPSTGALAIGTSFTVPAIIDTPRDRDDTMRGTDVELFVDGNSALFPVPPTAGDRVVIDDGSIYLVKYVDVDAVNGFYLFCQLKSRPVT